jgi:hypothetical protein
MSQSATKRADERQKRLRSIGYQEPTTSAIRASPLEDGVA